MRRANIIRAWAGLGHHNIDLNGLGPGWALSPWAWAGPGWGLLSPWRTLMCSHPTSDFCKPDHYWISDKTSNFSTIGQSVLEIRKRGAHVRMPIIGVGTGGATGAMTPSLFGQNCSENLSIFS